jgi:glycyl-tRNA synthetase beta subunit
MVAFLLEVGTEELPASFVQSAIAQWQHQIPEALSTASLSSEAIQVFATPRRLAVLVTGLPSQQPDRVQEIAPFAICDPETLAARPLEPAFQTVHVLQASGVDRV